MAWYIYIYVVARVELGLELSQLNSSPKTFYLGANVESSEKLIIRVEFLLMSWLR